MKTSIRLMLITALFPVLIWAQTHVVYQPTAENIFNPERGFYTMYTAQSESGQLSLTAINNIKNKKQSLMLRFYYFKKFLNSDLSQKQLDIIQNDFNTMRQGGIKCILRFAYSDNIGVADAPLSVVLRHLDQLKSLLQANADVIYVMQAGFIGAWGEWHSSTIGLDSDANKKIILTKILEVLPKTRMVQVRTPLYKQRIFSRTSPLTLSESFTETDIARVGYHNDCFISSYDDYGTYQDTLAEKNYLNQECFYVPIGAETCDQCTCSDCANAMIEMARLHLSYVHSDYYAPVISKWNANGCLPEITNRLGYRYENLEGIFSDSVKRGNALHFELKLRNTGYAVLYNKRKAVVVLRNITDTTKAYFAALPVDPRYWQSNDTTTLSFAIEVPHAIPTGNYNLYLSLPDTAAALKNNPLFAVRFANTNTWNSIMGYNNLLVIVNVNDTNGGETVSDPLSFSNGLTSIEKSENDVPNSFLIVENFPNPFNNETTIYYQISNDTHVKIKIFDSLGRELETLVDKEVTSGKHQTTFRAGKYASGIYLCVLYSENGYAISKLVYLK